MVRLTVPEHSVAYILASLSNGLLLAPLSELSNKTGSQLDLLQFIGFHQALLGILVLGVVISAAARRGWQWQYVGSVILFSGYVAYRMSTRFFASLQLVGVLQSQGVEVLGDLRSLYLFGLGAAASFALMILVLRKSYGKLVSFRTIGTATEFGDTSPLLVESSQS